MRFARRLVLLPLLSLLAACSPTTPLFVAQVTTGEVAEYKQMKSNRMTAAIEEEGDLLTYSAMAIRDNRSTEAEKLYLTGY
ncbi:MAG: outer membrane assembly lipoprotein YfiO, partial [Pseudomonas aeruginosa]|nr:outer membrane assembly lipoprotein YfiO [Pseudomonas aeruginosa]